MHVLSIRACFRKQFMHPTLCLIRRAALPTITAKPMTQSVMLAVSSDAHKSEPTSRVLHAASVEAQSRLAIFAEAPRILLGGLLASAPPIAALLAETVEGGIEDVRIEAVRRGEPCLCARICGVDEARPLGRSAAAAAAASAASAAAKHSAHMRTHDLLDMQSG
eukprot:1008908-Pleurochrysis_carterae.AAC.2